MGFDVWDYTLGKVDWIGSGLPTEGDGDYPGRVGRVMFPPPPTCGPDDDVEQALTQGDLVVVVAEDGTVLGRLRAGRAAAGRALDQMESGPTTARAHEEAAENRERMAKHNVTSMLVTTPEGQLIGELRPDDPT